MTLHDRRGLPVSTRSAVAAAHYGEGVDLMLAGWPGAAEALDLALAADPDFALAHAARARAHLVASEPALARGAIERAEALVERDGTERERSHVAAVALSIRGPAPAALNLVLAHSASWPRDAFILGMPLGAFGMFAFSGMPGHAQAGVDLCEAAASHYDGDWWFSTSRGWAHTENGNVGHGRRLTEQGLALRQENAHAVHALAHAMFEDGSNEDADALISDWLPGYSRAGILHGHIAWHQALVALQGGDAGRAIRIYEDSVRPAVSQGMPINILSDGAAFLWRLDAYGHGAPRSLWSDIRDYARPLYPNAGFAFADVHMAMIAAATGDLAAVAARAAALEQKIADGALPAGPVIPAICRALMDFAQGDYAACANRLSPVATEVERMGGSHAQREVVEDTLLVALMRSGETAAAGRLLDSRLHRRPSPRDLAWRTDLTAVNR